MMAQKVFISRLIFFIMFSILLFFPFISSAADGDELWESWQGIEESNILLSDGNGGAIIVWDAGSSPKQILAQRYDYDGNPLWGAGGKVVSDAVDAEFPAATEDGSGGVVVTWVTGGNVYTQRLDSSGSKQWNSNAGVLVFNTPYADEAPVISPDGFGGAYVGSKNRLAYVNGDGGVPDGVNGIELVSTGLKFSLIADGQQHVSMNPPYEIAGGVFAAWFDINDQTIRAQHVNAGKQWADAGALVSTVYTHVSLSTTFRDIKIVRDDAGGVIVTWRGWEGAPTSGTGQVRAQRLDSDGNPLWTVNGEVLVSTDVVGGNLLSWWNSFLPPEVVTDGNHGAIVVWHDLRHTDVNAGDTDIYVQRVDGSGSPQWATDGVWVIFAGDDITMTGSEDSPAVTSDGAGGVVIAVADYYLSTNIFANRIGSDGTMIWSKWLIWDDYDDGSGDTFASQTWPRIVFDGSGPAPAGVIISWDESGGAIGDSAQKLEIGSSPPVNDNSADASILTGVGGLDSWQSGTLHWATNDGTASCGTSGQPDVWYSYTVQSSGTLNVNTCGTNDMFGVDSGLDTTLALYDKKPDGTLSEMSCNDDATSPGCTEKDSGDARDSLVSSFVAAGKTVLIRLSRYSINTNGMYRLSYLFEPGVGGLEGDINGNGNTDLTDAILAFQVVAGIIPADSITIKGDVNADDKVGLAEGVYVLQKMAGVR